MPPSKKSRAAPKKVKREENGVVAAPEETQSKKPKASVKRVKKEQDNEADNAVNVKPKKSRQGPSKLKKEMVDDAKGSDTILPPPKTRATRKKGAAVVERPPGNEADGHAADSASEAKAEQIESPGSAFGSEDKLTTTNDRIIHKSGTDATKALPKQVKVALRKQIVQTVI